MGFTITPAALLLVGISCLACSSKVDPEKAAPEPARSSAPARAATATATATATAVVAPLPAEMPSSSGQPAASGAPAGDKRDLVAFNLVDADGAAMLMALGAAFELPVKIDADAQAIADCAMATIHMPDPLSRKEAFAAVAAALKPWGLVPVMTDTAILVHKSPDPPAKQCRKR